MRTGQFTEAGQWEQSRHLSGIRGSFLQVLMLNWVLRSGHLLDVRSIPGRDAVARGKRRPGVFSKVQEAGEVACWGWMWPRKIRWWWEVEGSKWG